MPIVSTTMASDRHKLVRLVRCVRGEMTFAIDIAPRFDYGRESYETHVSENGVVFQGSQNAMVLDLVREPDDARLANVQLASQMNCAPSSRCRPARCAGSCWKRVNRDLRE